MEWLKTRLDVRTPSQGLHDITHRVTAQLQAWKVEEGMCHLFIQHTSASLLVSENSDPTARQDLEEFLRRLAPENEPWHVHTLEGPDDSPSHLRALLTGTSESIPVDGGRLSLGTWQGIYLCEHRRDPQWRTVLLHCLKVL
ncbi:MAG TPA: secondary thiamine-phosphate synthase enzyme YjbQ [Fibrobacteria bacterium]|nr:secondary thiamine-phosphate synthase enzyme YjbQ [Fibrobacteria bacterium]